MATRSTRSSSRHSSANAVPPCQPGPKIIGSITPAIAASNPSYFARYALAEFIRLRAAMVKYPWFYTIQGNCMKSLLRQLGIVPKYYAALLLAAGFVSVRNMKSGEPQVRWNHTTFEDFMNNLQFGLRGPASRPNSGTSEYTSVQVLVDALKEHEEEELDPDGPKLDIYAIRIGEYGDESIHDPAGEINRGLRPPPFDAGMQRLQRSFHLQTRHIVALFISDQRIPAITRWVEIDKLEEKPRPRGPKLPSPSKAKVSIISPEKSNEKAAGNAITPSPFKDLIDFEDDDSVVSDDDSYGGGFDDDEDEDAPEVEMGNSKEFPLLSRLKDVPLFSTTKVGDFDLGKVTRSNLLREIVALCEKHDEPLQFETDNSRLVSTLLNAEAFKTDEEFSLGLDKLMSLMFETSGPDRVVRSIIGYLRIKCNKELMNELQRLQIAPRTMDEYDVAALMIHSSIQIGHWEKVVQALKVFMGLEKIAASKDKWRDLGKDYSKVQHDTFVYKKTKTGSSKGKGKGKNKKAERDEYIKYWWKDPMSEFKRNLIKVMSANAIHPQDIEFVHVINGGDHGKEKFRFTAKLVIRAKGKYHQIIYPIADVKCKKDSAEVLKGTILPKVSGGINNVATTDIHFYLDNGLWSCSHDKRPDCEPAVTKTPTSYLCGDLVFLCMVMGKAGYEKDWCYLCKLMAPDWQLAGAVTIESLIAKYDDNEFNRAKGTAMGGVKDKPYFEKILVKNVIWSVLHGMMGIGNDGVDYIVDFGECFVEDLPEEEVGMKNMIIFLEQRLAQARADRDARKKSPEGKELSGLPAKIQRLKTKIERGRCRNYAEIQAVKEREALLQARQVELQEILSPYVEEASALVEELSETKKKIEKFRSDRKSDNVSLYCDIDDILKRYGIHRLAYHSGQINGIGIKLLMDNAEEIMGDIKSLFLEKSVTRSPESDSKVEKFCKQMTLYFSLWDDAFSLMHTIDPVEDVFVKTQHTIDLAMSCMRDLGMSITPKAHGAEAHVVKQMHSTPGGISFMIEHWVERYHQVGFKYDNQWRLMKDEDRKANLRADREHIAANLEVIKRVQLLKASMIPVNARLLGKKRRHVKNSSVRDETRYTKRQQNFKLHPFLQISHQLQMTQKFSCRSKMERISVRVKRKENFILCENYRFQ